MASNIRSSGTAALRYASALVDLAMEQGAIQQIEKDVAEFQAMIENSDDLRKMIRSPLIGATQQKAALTAIAEQARFHALTRNFLLVLADNRRLRDAEPIIKAVKESIYVRRGELRAKVESAYALTDAQKQALQASLGQSVGRTVMLDTEIRADLIGGVVVTLGSVMIDDSVKSKLERMSRAMKYQSNQNTNKKEEVA